MKARNRTIIISGLIAGVIALSACSGGKNDAPATTPTPAPTTAPTEAPTEKPTETEAPPQQPTTEIAPTAFDGATFDNDGGFAFLRLDHTRKATSNDFTLELSDFDGQPAVKIAPQGGKLPWIGISASLLSDADMPKAATIALKIGVKSTDGTFWPITGSIYAYTGADLEENSTKFGIQTPESNPKVVYSKLAKRLEPGEDNYLMFAPSQDDGTGYAGKNEIYILGVAFLDDDGAFLPINAAADGVFPADFDVAEQDYVTENIPLEADFAAGGWINFSDEAVPIETWNRALAFVVDYAPKEDGESPIDTNPDAGKFVVQVDGGQYSNDWLEIELSDLSVERTEGKRLKLTLDGFGDITSVSNVGYGAWDGADTITGMHLVCIKGPSEYTLDADYAAGGWINFNSSDIPIEVWQGAKALIVEYSPKEDGESPIDTNPDAGKFVIQVEGGSFNNDWNEVELSDLSVERVEGEKLVLTLEGFKDVTAVSNVGYGAWDGADTITRMYLLTTFAPVYEYDLAADYAAGGWINFNSTDIPIEVWNGAKAFVVEYAPRDDGESPIDTNPDGGKFVIQAEGGAYNNDWTEVALNDLLVGRVEGHSVTLSLDGFKDVTSVSNVGYGAWDGADTITRMYLLTTYSE